MRGVDLMDYSLLAHVSENEEPVANEVTTYGDFEEFLRDVTTYAKYKNFEIDEVYEGKETIVVISYDIAEN